MDRQHVARAAGYYRATIGDRFLASSDLLWHVKHHVELRLAGALVWRDVANPVHPDRPGAEADVAGERVTIVWSDHGEGTTHLAGPGHTGG